MRIEIKIVLKDEISVHQTSQRLAIQKKRSRSQVQGWLDLGTIRPSCSEITTPVVPIKKDGI